MPNLLTVAQIRDHVETDLVDTALQRLVDDADAEIISRLGSLASVEQEQVCAGERYLSLLRVAAAITSVSLRIGQTDYPLAAGDYSLQFEGRMLERRQDDGALLPDLRWNGVATIVYVPDTSDVAQRTRLEIDLVKLSVAYDAQRSAKIGDATTAPLDYRTERENLFAPFMTKKRAWIV